MSDELSLDDLEDLQPRAAMFDGVPVCLVRSGDTVRAVHNTCSHQEYDLSEGMVWADSDGALGIECSLHGSTFDLSTGQPSAMPATKPVPTYAVSVSADGQVLVDTSSALNGADAPNH